MELKLSSGKNKRIFSALWQCTTVFIFFDLFFVLARSSELYREVWGIKICRIVSGGAVLCGVLTVLSASAAMWLLFHAERITLRRRDLIALGFMAVVHYLIRVGMVGTIQVDEGLTCYESLKYLSYNPEILLNNFIEGGKLADRNAYGYNFFALMGEFVIPGQGTGFQWVQCFLGMGAACCLYKILRRLFPKVRISVIWLAAFVVSVQPMFLGLSTLCGLEYGMTVFFIYAFYCCVEKKYILMIFWLAMLGTTKGSGMIMALCFAGAFLLARMIKLIQRKRGVKEIEENSDEDNEDGDEYNLKTGVIAIVAMVAVVVFVYGVLRICAANGIAFSGYYIKIKLAQLFVLNFNWIWLIVAVAGIIMVSANMRVRRTCKLDIVPLFVLVCCYVVYVLYLLAYPRATLPRYNMPADVLFTMFGVFFLLKLFERRRAIMTTLGFMGIILFLEVFVNIDPVSAELFTNVETNGFPMLYAAGFSKEKAVLNECPGDYGYYNYQYTFVDKAVDEILMQYEGEGDIIVFSSSSETETTFRQSSLKWNPSLGRRVYCDTADCPDCRNIVREAADGILKALEPAKQAVYIEIPWSHGDTEAIMDGLTERYEIVDFGTVDMGYAGSVPYYFLKLKE